MDNKRIIKQALTMLLAFAMVITMIPLLGVGVQEAYAATGGEVVSNDASTARTAFGSSNVDASYDTSKKTLTIALKENVTLSNPVVFKRGTSGDKVVLNLAGHTITGKAGTTGSNKDAATGGTAIRIVAGDFNVEIKGNGSTGDAGTVKGGNGVKYETDDHRLLGADGGMAVAFADSSWKPTANNGKLTYGLTVTGGATLRGGDGADLTGADWLYNIGHYDGNKRHSSASYDCIMFTLRPGRGGDGIGQTGAYVSEGLSDKAYASIVVENGKVAGGCGGKVDLNVTGMPVLTHYELMHNGVITSFLNEEGVTGNNKYYAYITNQIKFLPGNGGDGIVIGDGRKYVYIAQSGYVQGGASGGFDYGNSKFVNQFDSIGAGRVATAGNGISVYGDVGLTNISPTDKTVTSGNAASKTKDSNEMGIYIAGTVKGGSSPNAVAMNEYSGDAGNGISIDGFYGREDWGIIEVGQGGMILGGDTGNAAYGSVGTPKEAIREWRTKGHDAHDTRYGTDFFIISGDAKGGNGGNSLGLTPAGAGASGMTFNTYRYNLRIYGNGTVAGGNYGTETDHGQSTSTYKPEAIHMRTDSSNIVNVKQAKGSAATKVKVDKLKIRASMSHFAQNPSTDTQLSLSGIPDGYTGDVFIRWCATIYETSSIGSVTYDIESSGANLESFNMLSNTSYGDFLAYPAYPSYISAELNMNKYNADVATVNRMSEDDKYQTDIYCYVVLEDGRWGKSNVMRYQKNKGWDGTGNLPDEDGGDEPEPVDPEMAEVLAIGQAIKNLPKPEAVKAEHNTAIVDAYEKYHDLEAEQRDKYLFDYDYGAKVDACFAALAAIVGNDDQALIQNIENILNELPDVLSLNNEANVKAAQAAYNNLSTDAKSSFDADKKAELDHAVAEIDRLRAAADAQYCAHTEIVAVESKPATCTKPGNISYYKCKACDTYFSDYGGLSKIEDKESVVIPVSGSAHEYGEWSVISEPTCKVAGMKQRTCPNHPDEWQKEEIPVNPDAHNWGLWTRTKNPTCSSAGEEKRTCSTCDKEETRTLNTLEHEWGAWQEVSATCTDDGYRTRRCSNCPAEETEVIPAGHDWGAWTTKVAATCISGGQDQRVCKRDPSHVETRDTAALGHSWSSWTSQQPTEEAAGVVTHSCSRCGSTYYTAIAPITLPTDLPGVKVSKPAKGKKAVTVKWKKIKNKKQLSQIGGIEIQITGPGVNMVTTAGKKKASKKVKGLLPKQTYRCRVRAYNNIGGVKHVSAWSGWKSVKTK